MDDGPRDDGAFLALLLIAMAVAFLFMQDLLDALGIGQRPDYLRR